MAVVRESAPKIIMIFIVTVIVKIIMKTVPEIGWVSFCGGGYPGPVSNLTGTSLNHSGKEVDGHALRQAYRPVRGRVVLRRDQVVSPTPSLDAPPK